jgi:hypothetical protein
MCSTALFVKTWMCLFCGMELCFECKDMFGVNVSPEESDTPFGPALMLSAF